MKVISKQQIITMQKQLIIQSGGISGLRDEGLLESAIATPFQEFCGVSNYPTMIEKTVRLAYGIIKNHPFIDGNKRIGAHVLLVVLYLNGIELKYEQEELVRIILDVADGTADYGRLFSWVTEHEIK